MRPDNKECPDVGVRIIPVRLTIWQRKYLVKLVEQ